MHIGDFIIIEMLCRCGKVSARKFPGETHNIFFTLIALDVSFK